MQQRVNVLIVDDSIDDAGLLWQTLSKEGYEVVYQVVDTPEAMRAALEHQEWDLITSELYMPNFSASEALELAKEVRPNVPYIIVSDDIALSLVVSLMKAGANDYIQKCVLARLVPVVQRVLRESEARCDRKRMDAAFRSSEMRYRRLFETAKDGILILDADTGGIVDVNPFLMDMLGYSYDDFIGKKLWEIGMFLDITASKDAFHELQEKGYVRFEDLPLKKHDGQILNVEYVCNVYLVEGEKVIQCNIRDITARKKAEAQIIILDAFLEKHAAKLETANSDLEAFNYTVSHDLLSPLTIINGYCQRIKKVCSTKLDEQSLEYISVIQAEAQRMKELVDTLLELSCLTKCKLNPVPVDLSELVKSVTDELILTNPQRHVTFTIAEKVMVTGDQKLFHIALENLLGNAWKYTDKTAEAVIEFGCSDCEGSPVYFVRDNGAGFDMAQADKLFTAFSRLKGSETYEGMGIGLATVKRIIDRHGGKVWAESEVGTGATFFFTLEHLGGAALNAQQNGEHKKPAKHHLNRNDQLFRKGCRQTIKTT